MSLTEYFTLWSHEVTNKNWDLKSYKSHCIINNIESFWKLFNNFNKIGYKHLNFYFMKNNIVPMWEHEANRDGGVCSFKIDIEDSIPFFEELAVYMISGQLSVNPDDINGISFTPKNNWIIIKIWNKHKNDSFIETLNKTFTEKYKHLNHQYTENTAKANFRAN